jgi:Protein of unknown function (DUF3099)
VADNTPGQGSPPGHVNREPATKLPATVITDARSGTSKDLASRQKRYAITMAFRTACFIAMMFVPGIFRWVLFAGAVFLPYVAVIFANQANTRTAPAPVQHGEPSDARQLTAGNSLPDVIRGDIDNVADEDQPRHDRVA